MGDKAKAVAAALVIVFIFALYGIFAFWAGAAYVSFQHTEPIIHNVMQNGTCEIQENGTCLQWRVECTGTVNGENPMTGVMWLPSGGGGAGR